MNLFITFLLVLSGTRCFAGPAEVKNFELKVCPQKNESCLLVQAIRAEFSQMSSVVALQKPTLTRLSLVGKKDVLDQAELGILDLENEWLTLRVQDKQTGKPTLFERSYSLKTGKTQEVKL